MSTHKPDLAFIVSIFILLGFGLLMLFSASSSESYNTFHDAYFLIKRQIFLGVIPGLILFFLLSRLDYNFWRKINKPFFCLSILLLVLVLLPGWGGQFGTAKSWLSLAGLSFQPSELAKLSLVIYLASWLSGLKKEDFFNWRRSLLPFLVLVGIFAVLLMKQPDLGTFLVIFSIAVIMYFIGGGQLAHLIGILAVSLTGFISLIFVSPYRFRRILSFFNPQTDVLGISYHINQALLAIGSGGFWGLGWGHSRQKFQYLPQVSADSIFAIIGEELGFVLSALFILFLGFIFWRGLKIAQSAPSQFGKLLVVGVMVWFIGQALINIGAMVAILPLTGLPLPLVSHGGTAMMVMLAALGIVVSVSRQARER